jgi:hypothetical protein
MSDLIPSMTITEFKQLKASDIRELKAVEVLSDGEHLFTAIIPHGDILARDYIRVQSEYLALKANISGGVNPEELKDKVDAVV